MGRYVVGVSGASGVILARRAALALLEMGHYVELVMTSSALYTTSYEMGSAYAATGQFLHPLSSDLKERLTLHSIHDVGSSIASGSFVTDGMLIIPCSMGTLAAISTGLADNALRRAADVTLKERRRLVIVPREAPLSEIHLEHMLRLTRLGAIIVPPMPAWYTQPKSVEEIELFIVGKAFDALKIEHTLYPRWKK